MAHEGELHISTSTWAFMALVFSPVKIVAPCFWLLASLLWAPWEQCRGLGSARSIPGQRSSLSGAGKKHPPSIQWCHRNVSPGKGYWKKQRSSLLLQQLVENSVQCSL